MLVLSRQAGDSILIGEHIEITILQIRGNSVKLGVVAPRQVPVHRAEIYVTINDPLPSASSSTVRRTY